MSKSTKINDQQMGTVLARIDGQKLPAAAACKTNSTESTKIMTTRGALGQVITITVHEGKQPTFSSR